MAVKETSKASADKRTIEEDSLSCEETAMTFQLLFNSIFKRRIVLKKHAWNIIPQTEMQIISLVWSSLVILLFICHSCRSIIRGLVTEYDESNCRFHAVMDGCFLVVKWASNDGAGFRRWSSECWMKSWNHDMKRHGCHTCEVSSQKPSTCVYSWDDGYRHGWITHTGFPGREQAHYAG